MTVSERGPGLHISPCDAARSETVTARALPDLAEPRPNAPQLIGEFWQLQLARRRARLPLDRLVEVAPRWNLAACVWFGILARWLIEPKDPLGEFDQPVAELFVKFSARINSAPTALRSHCFLRYHCSTSLRSNGAG